MLALRDDVVGVDQARMVGSWRYEPPCDLYDPSEDEAVALLTERDEQGHGYYPALEGGEFVGFACFGREARVRGQREHVGTCDVGIGLRPDRLSAGLGTRLLPLALGFAVQRFRPDRLRVAVAAFNERSIRLFVSAGFDRARDLAGPAGRPFVEMELDVPHETGAGTAES